MPDSIKPPSDQRLVLQGHASGDQIYICQPSARSDSQFAWVLSAPDAKLTDDNGKEIAKHFAGPTWQSTDGSQLKGKVVSQTDPNPHSIPWLLLIAVDHSGAGVMSDVRTIQRLNTKGGKAPATGCDAQHQGEKVRVNYTADYYFYAPAGGVSSRPPTRCDPNTGIRLAIIRATSDLEPYTSVHSVLKSCFFERTAALIIMREEHRANNSSGCPSGRALED